MNLTSDFDFKKNVSDRFGALAGDGAAIRAFHDVDEGRRIAMREAFEHRVGVSKIAKQFEVSESEVWSAAKNDRSIGGVLNERFWRHGLTVSLGNGLNVSEKHVRRRLRYVGLRLKRMIWGQKRQRAIEFIVFKHQLINLHKRKQELEKGSKDWSDQRQKQLVEKRYQALQTLPTGRSKYDRVGEHWHAVMAVYGNHNWSDQEVAEAIIEIEKNRKREHQWEKEIDVQWNWRDGNGFHSYVGREAKYDDDSYFIMRL